MNVYCYSKPNFANSQHPAFYRQHRVALHNLCYLLHNMRTVVQHYWLSEEGNVGDVWMCERVICAVLPGLLIATGSSNIANAAAGR